MKPESYYTPDGDIAYIRVRQAHGTIHSQREPWGLRDYDQETGELVALELWDASKALPRDVIDALPRLEGQSDVVITQEELAKEQPA